MKKIFTLLFVAFTTLLQAQPRFLGVTEYQGGTIFQYDAASQSVSTLYRHKVQETFPAGTLSTGPDGQLYGTTLNGGVSGSGAIYRFNPQSGQYTTLYTFRDADGIQPTGELCWGANGMMYGMTTYGGNTNSGVLFAFNTRSNTYQVLHHFDGLDGANPTGGLLRHTNGLLYGTTQKGGTANEGVLFTFNPQTGLVQKLADFQMATGAHPTSGLVAGKDGKLYGATAAGGPDEANAGAIFRFDPVKKTLAPLYYFRWDNNNGFAPVGRLLLQPDGRLYGVTQHGGINGSGAIFRFNPANRAFSRLRSFDAAVGGEPAGGLEADGAGRFYGFTRKGSANNQGGIYRYDPVNKTMTSLHAFAYGDGVDPSGSACLTPDGRLYGVAPFGGSKEYGTLFSVHTANGGFTKHVEFDEAPDGAFPVGAPVRHTDGVYYGTTNGGGNYGQGVIYAFRPVGGQYEVVYRFSEAHGQYMGSGFVAGNDGQLYGLLSSGGAGGGGQLISYSPATQAVTIVHQFSTAGAAYPQGGLVKGADGFFYGVTAEGGSAGMGTIFRFDAAALTCTPVASFSGSDGATPMDGLTAGPDGLLYGITQWGGAHNQGTLYVFNPAAGTLTRLHDFDGTTGAHPLHGLMLAPDGRFYGVTASGGSLAAGVLYRYNPATHEAAVLHEFDGNTGVAPQGRLSMGGNGFLYGLTRNGGAANLGVVFKMELATASISGAAAFAGSGSGNASGSGLTAWCAQPALFYRDQDGDGFGAAVNGVAACVAPVGYVATNTDCNDTNATVYPGAPELCGNGVDDDCDGAVDEGCSQQPQLQVQAIQVAENNRYAQVVVALDKPAGKNAQVHFQTEPVSASAGKDFGMRKGVLRFAEGSLSAVIWIPVYVDDETEPDELFRVILSKPRALSLSDAGAAAAVTINDRQQKGGVLFAVQAKSLAAPAAAASLDVLVYPNPATGPFTLVPGFGNGLPVQVVVTDAAGKIRERRNGLAAGQPVALGAGYAKGVYLIQVGQGGRRVVVKLVCR